MFKNLITSAVFAGFGAGLIAALLHVWLVAPVILEAELYEDGIKVHYGTVMPDHTDNSSAHADEGHGNGSAERSLFSRHGQSVLWTLGTYLGFALVMVAGFAMAQRAGISVNARTGLIWGAAGYVAFYLLPSAGLPPELPGSSAAELQARQIWQVFVTAASVIGIASIAFGKNWMVWGAGIAIMALPHITGAPMTHDYGGVTPPELAAHFASLTLAVGIVAWLALGLIAGFFWQRSST